jgi:Fur family transcriptional regulator, peroxide stress response regulator
MSELFERLKVELKKGKIPLSYQRLKILEYLSQNLCHPTVEQIFSHLSLSIPTLSKTTVYNTLHVLVEAGLVRVVDIYEHESRYDTEIEGHGHFKCESCGEIYNICINLDLLCSEDLKQFEIKEKVVYFKGICPKCISKKTNKGG